MHYNQKNNENQEENLTIALAKNPLFLFFAFLVTVLSIYVIFAMVNEKVVKPEYRFFIVEDSYPYTPRVFHPNIEQSDIEKKASKWLVKRLRIEEDLAKEIAFHAMELEHGLALLAILCQESSGDPLAKLGNNYGLCQISTIHLDPREIKRLKNTPFESIDVCGIEKPADLYDIGKNMCAANIVFNRIYTENNNNFKKALINYNANDRHKYVYSNKVSNYYASLAKHIGVPKVYRK